MFRLVKLALAITLGLCVWNGSSAAQCPVPDQLDGGPCCAIATPKLPLFPSFSQDALEICWLNCSVDAQIRYRATWNSLTIAPTVGMPCGERMVRLDIRDTAGILQWTGILRLQYSRTWLEIDPAGLPLQVWRFLVNGDMQPATAAAVIPCPVPPCVPANNNRARFTGYIDYAANCALVPNSYQHAWMLTHACDAIDHHVGFPRAGVFHPDRTYTFVGPGAGFVASAILPAEGTPGSGFEELRRRNFPPLGTVGPVTCDYEERLNFSLLPFQQLCLCGPATAQPQIQIANLTVAGACGTSVTSPGGPFLPGFLSMAIGSWTIPGTFPGLEAVRWTAGGYDYVDPCIGVLRQEVFYGATTIGGFTAIQLLVTGPGGPLPLTFIDQSNSLRPPTALGTIMNVPYISDHFLALNH